MMKTGVDDLLRRLRNLAVLGCSVAALCACGAMFGSSKQQPAPLDNPIPVQDTHSDSVDIQSRQPDSDLRRRARLRMELAVSYYQDGKLSVALDELKQALSLDPNFAQAHGVLALVYMGLGEKTLAEQSFLKALSLQPTDPEINNNYGWFLCQNGREQLSLQYFAIAIKNPLYAEPARPLQNAGVCTLRLGDKETALTYFRRSFELDPTGAVSAFNLAQLYFERKDLERARFYAALVNRTPAANAVSLWLGIRIEHSLGHRTEELSLAAQLQRGFPNSSQAELLARHAYDE